VKDHEHSARRIALAFGLVYLCWGSTYLAVHFAVETIPALLMAGSRQLLAGLVLYPVARLRGEAKPTLRQWVTGGFIGVLLVVGGNGSIAWAEYKRTPSNVTAVLVATVPLWMAILDWLRPGGPRPTGRIVAGLAIGMGGVGLLLSPSIPFLHTAGTAVSSSCAAILVGGSLCWAIGSILSRHLKLPRSPLLGTAMFTMTGGAMLLLLGLAGGEGRVFDMRQVSMRSVLAALYLSIFGSIVGFSAYVYLLRKVSASRVATYAYVNPVIAVSLGWAFAGESLTPRMMLAAAIILAAVVLVITAPHVPTPEELSGQPVVPEEAV
jgi:drug/metabolite transporter (DMT)-like permease